MNDRAYTMMAWGEDLTPEHFDKIREFARSIAGDGVKVSLVDTPVVDGVGVEFERETFGHDGSWRDKLER